LGAVAGIVVLSGAVWLVIYYDAAETTRTRMVGDGASVLLQLVLISVFGLVAKHFLDEHIADRDRRLKEHAAMQEQETARRQKQIQTLNSAVASYFEIKKALLIINAHRSAKSYGEQMRQILDYRVELQRLQNETRASVNLFRGKRRIVNGLGRIDKLLERLVDEWEQCYPALSVLQRRDEQYARAIDDRWKEAYSTPEHAAAAEIPAEQLGPRYAELAVQSLRVLARVREDRLGLITDLFFCEVIDPIRAELHQAPSKTDSDCEQVKNCSADEDLPKVICPFYL
jgi:hypothetical protein